jgi:hypothetical protein
MFYVNPQLISTHGTDVLVHTTFILIELQT